MRLLTRADFDGLVCATLLKELGVVDKFKFVHPKDMQDGIIEVDENDVIANVPYVPGCGMWFDHHTSEQERLDSKLQFKGKSQAAPSCARVIYEYYGGKERLGRFEEMVTQADKVDSGQISIEEIQNPTRWVLFGFVMDPRTGLERFTSFGANNEQLMQVLIDACRRLPIERILELPEIAVRVKLYFEQNEQFKKMLLEKSYTDENIIIIDVRGLETIYTGNRFLIYSLFPEQNISIWITDGKAHQNCVFSVGYSTINRTAKIDVGSLMLKYGGGGHKAVGTCQVKYSDADRVLKELIEAIKKEA